MNEVGFTGTRAGMTGDQAATVGRLLATLFKGPSAEFHHGDAVGADQQAAALALAIGYEPVPHPGGDAARNIARNHEIVEVSKVMIAAPYGGKEVLRSGTWATIRFSKGELKQKPSGGFRPIYVVWPDGGEEAYGFNGQ